MCQAIDRNDASVRVLRAGTGDLPLARQAVREVHGRRLESEEATAAFLADETCYLYVAVAGDEVVGSLNGYALAHPHTSRPQFLLYEIDVREAWRRRGIGSRLVEAFLAEAKRLDAFGAWVVTDRGNEPAMAMYRRCGLATSDLDDAVFTAEFPAEAPPSAP
jgi:GNAT superfamily N-acetyltransferase